MAFLNCWLLLFWDVVRADDVVDRRRHTARADFASARQSERQVTVPRGQTWIYVDGATLGQITVVLPFYAKKSLSSSLPAQDLYQYELDGFLVATF